MQRPSCEEQILRLLHTVKLFYRGDTLSLNFLADHFNKSTRTIRRDIKRLETIFPLQKTKEGWQLDFSTLSQTSVDTLSKTLLHSFAANAALQTPCFDHDASTEEKVTFAIKYDHLPKILGKKIIEALEKEVQCRITYQKPAQSQSQRIVDPIRLFSDKGIWYLIVRDYKDDKVKFFRLDRMKQFELLSTPATLTQAMRGEAKAKAHIWQSGGEGSEVHLYIKPEASDYIQSSKLLHPTQTITNTHEDGGIEVTCTITHKLELLPAIKSWIPHIFIISPSWLWDELQQDLQHYQHEDSQINSIFDI